MKTCHLRQACIWGSLLLVVVSGCWGGTPLVNTSSPTKVSPVRATGTSVPIWTPLPTVTTTSTPLPFTPSPAAWISPTIPAEVLRFQCPDVTKDLPSTAIEAGILVLADDEDFSAYLMDTTGWIESPLPEGEYASLMDFAVSPDRQWLAYEVYEVEKDQSTLVIIRADGSQKITIAMEEWWRDFEWLDTERLAIERLIGDWDPNAPLIILNPFTGQRQELRLQIQGMYMDRVHWGAFSSIKGVYDPTLTRVVYPLQEADVPAVLRDVETGQDIVSIPYGRINIPRWSPDGKRVAVVALVGELGKPREEFFIMNWEGEVTQSTHLNEYLSNTWINTFSWSPDGQHIAFWLNTDPEFVNWSLKTEPIPYDHLAVLDTVTGTVIDYCILGHPGFTDGITFSPIWSPDGQQLLVQSIDPENSERFPVVIVDIYQGWATEISENLLPVGWLMVP